MAATSTTSFLLVVLVASQASSWENLPQIPAGRRAEYYLQHDDGAYKYGYDTGTGQSAQVDADPANEVQGRYQYVDKAGRQVALQYKAGQAGFVPQLEGVLAPSAGPLGSGVSSGIASASLSSSSQDTDSQVDTDYDANGDASYSFNIDTDSYKRSETADARGNIRGQYSYSSAAGGSHGLSYVAGEGTGFMVTSADNSGYSAPGAPSAVAAPYSGPLSNNDGIINPDGSYSFSYSSSDQSRQESADAENNVRGSYSFRAKDDGKTRRVDYKAGSATGFVATGDHLPVAPSSEGAVGSAGYFKTAAPQLASSAAISSYTGPSSNAQNTINPDGSYSFSFSGDGQSREETADAHNNVRGSYSFRAKDDGQSRRVDYKAGSATGFIASGAHLPVPSSPLGGHRAYVVAPPPASFYNAPSAAASPYSPVASDSHSQNPANSDGSYSFSFDTGEQSRQESADSNNNVKGSFSFKAKDDGKTRRVDYEAGAKTGFIAKGDHLPVAPSGSASPSAFVSSYSSPEPVAAREASLYSAPVSPVNSKIASNEQGGSNADGSYFFSFNTDKQSREESADVHNNVRGSYSFIAKNDGKTRRVDYVAGAATGFVARGDHLPVAPEVPRSSDSSGVATLSTYSLPGASSAISNPAVTGSDGSYSFSYSSADQSREEASDPRGNVRGRYSFKAKDDGKTRTVHYEAGAEKGFIAKGAHLPVAGVSLSSLGAYNPISTYEAPSASFDTSGSYRESSQDGSKSSQNNGDGSYSYTYQTDSSSKTETSDAQGNVQGEFSYIGGDGVTRKLKYTSRGKDGFIAGGDHLPKPVSAPTSGAGVPGVTSYSSSGALQNLAIQGDSHSAKSEIESSGFVLNKYLPPESPHKFGYIFDTKV